MYPGGDGTLRISLRRLKLHLGVDCASHGFSSFECRYYVRIVLCALTLTAIVSRKAFKLFSRLSFICYNVTVLRALLPGMYDCVALLLHSGLLKSSLSTRSGLTLLTSLV